MIVAWLRPRRRVPSSWGFKTVGGVARSPHACALAGEPRRQADIDGGAHDVAGVAEEMTATLGAGKGPFMRLGSSMCAVRGWCRRSGVRKRAVLPSQVQGVDRHSMRPARCFSGRPPVFTGGSNGSMTAHCSSLVSDG